ncbi:hypothetical protein OsJ_15987 [Oryza sativa Japonica Group]|uniref:Uncharacterized protein n=2 Tax=Oryza sativa subsp. japonica TaxID=39947 RepID=B9FC87_ORYSJ|nr:hypothetical protein OsJ_15987 [Oryza sativa Japonica Group]
MSTFSCRRVCRDERRLALCSTGPSLYRRMHSGTTPPLPLPSASSAARPSAAGAVGLHATGSSTITMAPAHRHTACCALRSTPAAMLWGISYVLVKQLPGVEEKSPSSTTVIPLMLIRTRCIPSSIPSSLCMAYAKAARPLPTSSFAAEETHHNRDAAPAARRPRPRADVVVVGGQQGPGGHQAYAQLQHDGERQEPAWQAVETWRRGRVGGRRIPRRRGRRRGGRRDGGGSTRIGGQRNGQPLAAGCRGVIPDHARPEQQQQPVQDTVPLQHARMVDMGGGVMAPMPAPSTHYPARDRELLAGSAGAGAGEEEPSADAAVDEEVERKGAALAASSAWSTTSTYLASMLRRRRKRPPATSSDVAWTVEDAVVNDELRSGTWMTKDTPVGEELRRGMWMTKDTTAGDEL